jgi:aubergine
MGGATGDTFAFDGMQLFLLKRLEERTTYLKSKRNLDGQEFEISIQLVSELVPKDCYQLYNILFRKVRSAAGGRSRAMDGPPALTHPDCGQFLRLLKLKQIGRNYYDPTKSAAIPQHHMELWPGYQTAIAEYDLGSMLNIDVTHKVLRTGTCAHHRHWRRRPPPCRSH